MSDIQDQPVTGIVGAPVARRTVMRRIAALPVASAMAGSGMVGLAGSAVAATRDSRIQARDLRYAISGGRILDGFFAAPRGKTNLGVIVVIHDENGLDSTARATAIRYAQAGYYAVAPDLRKNFGGLDHDARVAEMVRTAPHLKRLPHGNGNVTIVSAA